MSLSYEKVKTFGLIFLQIIQAVWVEFYMLLNTGLLKLIIVVIIIMSVFLERFSMWNMLSWAEQVQIQK